VIRTVLEDMNESGMGPTGDGTYRPALRRLTIDLSDLVEGNADKDVPGLKHGFADRNELVRWEQCLCVRSLGNVPQYVYQGLASQMASPKERPVIQALIDADEMPDATAKDERQRFRKRVVMRAFDRAFRRLRLGAKEYIDDADDGDEHDPQTQKHIAMRPSLDELDSWQRVALDQVLEGFDSRDEILDWASVLENATHGEPIEIPDPNEDAVPVSKFVAGVHERDPFAEMMMNSKYRRVRGIWAARFLIPSFNAGVRDIFPASGELPKGVVDDSSREPTDW
jgi:hypothetical protein